MQPYRATRVVVLKTHEGDVHIRHNGVIYIDLDACLFQSDPDDEPTHFQHIGATVQRGWFVPAPASQPDTAANRPEPR